jgi:hypothetical protein
MNLASMGQTSAERPAPGKRMVFVRDHYGRGKRVPLDVADNLVLNGLADRVSAAGHVRLKLGIKIEKIDAHRGALASTTTIGRREVTNHHPRCMEWNPR